MKKRNYLIVAIFCASTMGLALVFSPEKKEGPKIREIDGALRKEEFRRDPGKEKESGNPKEMPLFSPPLPVAEIPDEIEAGIWQHIVLHHSGTARGNAALFDKNLEKRSGKDGKGSYHFVIGNGSLSKNGEIEAGRAWKKQKTLFKYPKNEKMCREAISICLVGNFEKKPPSSEQIESLRPLLKHFVSKWGIKKENILPHNKVPGEKTLSPGKYFPSLDSILKE